MVVSEEVRSTLPIVFFFDYQSTLFAQDLMKKTPPPRKVRNSSGETITTVVFETGKNGGRIGTVLEKRGRYELKRLHSLLFGADLAFHKGDFASALFLGLPLVSFLDSHSKTNIDDAFIWPIRREALSKINSARGSLISESNRAHEDHHSSQGDQLDRPDKLGYKTSKVMTQAKLATMYGNSPPCKSFLNFRRIGSEDCTIMEKAHSYHSLPKAQGISTFSKVEDEERAHGNSFGTKRTYMEISSPRNENMKSPTSNEEANTMFLPMDLGEAAQSPSGVEIRPRERPFYRWRRESRVRRLRRDSRTAKYGRRSQRYQRFLRTTRLYCLLVWARWLSMRPFFMPAYDSQSILSSGGPCNFITLSRSARPQHVAKYCLRSGARLGMVILQGEAGQDHNQEVYLGKGVPRVSRSWGTPGKRCNKLPILTDLEGRRLKRVFRKLEGMVSSSEDNTKDKFVEEAVVVAATRVSPITPGMNASEVNIPKMTGGNRSVRAQARDLSQRVGQTYGFPLSLDRMRINLKKLAQKVEESKGVSSSTKSTPAAKGVVIREKCPRDEVPDISPNETGSKGKKAMPLSKAKKKSKSTVTLSAEASGKVTRPMALGKGTLANLASGSARVFPSCTKQGNGGRSDSSSRSGRLAFQKLASELEEQLAEVQVREQQAVEKLKKGFDFLQETNCPPPSRPWLDLEGMGIDHDLLEEAKEEEEENKEKGDTSPFSP
ncbi:hypothetical protein Acr_05g0009670 [Actinidia rufa]|uniref:FIGL1 N-terminal domain-containing protein n=1 Tax=Actinidia rufa TaxID=165716 RepID=A0A7J0ELJ5_9ERIC|nr:hypothetical protein Acr_05g0009670 [Actinidia rufa]